MEKNRKKEILREYKERKQQTGVFAVRCATTGQAWLASTRNLDTMQNRIWFELRSGGHTNKAMQAAWNAHGVSNFAYEIVEEVTDENPLLVDSLLKERERHWLKTTGAQPVVG
jgi:hypothetical protein